MGYQRNLVFHIGLSILLSNALIWGVAAQPATPVTVVEVVSQTVQEEVPLSGTAESMRESAISSRVDGIVDTILVTEGDWIKAGQKIMVLDNAIAALEVASAQARVNEAIARHKDAKRLKTEYESLKQRKAVAATVLATAVADEEAARAAVARQRADLQQWQERLARHTLYAPFSGLVAQKHVDAGQWVKADAAVIQLVDLVTIRIRAALPQRYYAQLAQRARTRIVFDALPDQPYFGEIAAVVAVGNQNTRSFPLLIELDNAERTLAPGMSARIFIQLRNSQAQALLVPRDAIVLKPDGSRIVWRLVEREGQLQAAPVKLFLGRPQGALVEVLGSALQAGDRVVLLGNENLRPNQQVRIVTVNP